MSAVTIFTSGSTQEPKKVLHSWNDMQKHVDRAVKEIGLTTKDKVLDVFPANTIAHYTVTAMPAMKAGCELFTASFDAYSYIKLFNSIRPSYIALIPRHIDILKKTNDWDNLDMSCVRYMVVGSQRVTQSLIDSLNLKGVKTVANWYGMTEMPPPVLVGYNSESFDFSPQPGYTVEFADDGECVINGYYTGDIFDMTTRKFLQRKSESNGSTWKTI